MRRIVDRILQFNSCSGRNGNLPIEISVRHERCWVKKFVRNCDRTDGGWCYQAAIASANDTGRADRFKTFSRCDRSRVGGLGWLLWTSRSICDSHCVRWVLRATSSASDRSARYSYTLTVNRAWPLPVRDKIAAVSNPATILWFRGSGLAYVRFVRRVLSTKGRRVRQTWCSRCGNQCCTACKQMGTPRFRFPSLAQWRQRLSTLRSDHA